MSKAMTHAEILRRKWCWRKSGREYHLSTESGGGVTVLATNVGDSGVPHIAVRDGDGILVPVTPDHPIAKAVAELPNLLASCRHMAELLREAKGTGWMAEHVSQVCDEAEATVRRATE